MASGSKPAANRNGGKTPGPKKGSSRKAAGARVTDPFTGEPFTLILHRLPGKGNIPLKVIREAVKKVRDERLARESQPAVSE